MQQPLPKPEMVSSFGSLKLIQDLVDYDITIEIKDSKKWHKDTREFKVSKTVTHFLEPDDAIVGIKVESTSKLDKKFENVPVEKDTTMIASLNMKFGDLDAHYEKWVWDGLYGKTMVFLNDDIKDQTHDDLKQELIDSTLANIGEEITVKETDLYTLFNYNFTYDEDA